MRISPETAGAMKKWGRRGLAVVALPAVGLAAVYALSFVTPTLAESGALTKRDLEETGGVNLEPISGTKSFIIRFRQSANESDRIVLLSNSVRRITQEYECEAVSPPVYYPIASPGQYPVQTREAYMATCIR